MGIVDYLPEATAVGTGLIGVVTLLAGPGGPAIALIAASMAAGGSGVIMDETALHAVQMSQTFKGFAD